MSNKLKVFFTLFFWMFLFTVPSRAWSAEQLPEQLKEIARAPNLGAQLDMKEEFLDETGQTVTLGSFFTGQKPVLLLMNYYGCPMLCGMLLNGARDGLMQLSWTAAEHYKVVSISIDPKEGPDLAASKKESMIQSLPEDRRDDAKQHWHFLVGKNGSEARISKAIGFGYKWVEEEKQYAHGAAIYFLTPKGVLSRILEGIQFEPRDLKFAVLEAGEGKVGSFAEKLSLFCYHWDPKDSKYVLLASRLVSLGGALTVVVGLACYLVLFLRHRRKGKTCSPSL